MGLQDRDYIRERNKRNENVENFSRHRQNRQQQQQTNNEQNRNEQRNPSKFSYITNRYIYLPILIFTILTILFVLLDYFNANKNQHIMLGSLRSIAVASAIRYWVNKNKENPSQDENNQSKTKQNALLVKQNSLQYEEKNQKPLDNANKPKWQKVTVCNADNNCKIRYTNIF